jgi:hypothetical protein
MRIAHSSWRGRLLPAPNVQSRLAESMAADWKLLCVHGRTFIRLLARSLCLLVLGLACAAVSSRPKGFAFHSTVCFGRPHHSTYTHPLMHFPACNHYILIVSQKCYQEVKIKIVILGMVAVSTLIKWQPYVSELQNDV